MTYASRLTYSGWLLMQPSKGSPLDLRASQRSCDAVPGTTHSFAVQGGARQLAV